MMLCSRTPLGFMILLYCFTTVVAKVTDSAEVEALKDIGAALGKEWDFGVDPCSGQSGWVTAPVASDIVDDFYANNVTCGVCSFDATINDTVCHVTNIRLKAQSLPGTLPPDFARLPYLEEIDLTRNYLSGTIPPQWSSLPLHSIVLLGNRLTGPIPKEFGNISTLQTLYVENNQLSGPLPPELGNLTRMRRLIFSSNNFTGELPSSFAKLTELIDMRLGDNKFNGTIPGFIQNWTKLTRLDIQASGLQGPIPSTIKALRLLTTLIISDLNGPEAPFPQLNRSSLFQTLILRNCNLTGQLPDYLPQILNSSYLDLSFNKLNGAIPSSYSSLVSKAKVIILAGNMLTGNDWITSDETNVDLSYNNFTTGSSSCQVGKVNLFASSSAVDKSETISCVGSSSACSRTYDSLYINCGGKETKIGSTTYEGDSDEGSAAQFYQSPTNWAYSSTGFYQEAKNPQYPYIFGNASTLPVNGNPQLYMDARLSPVSLTYYAYCLANGSYNVSLHFAEIMFSAGRNYSSLGRRVFDVYIQGILVLKDFNIEDAAGGFGRAIVKSFMSDVNDSTLEIQLFWAGKGTTAIPIRGVYGPLISAISVKSNFNRKSKMSVVITIVIVLSSVLVVSLVVGILRWKSRQKTAMAEDMKTGSFTLRQIKAATNNFDSANMIGEGGFGSVYKGMLSDGSVIAVKQLSAKSKQGNREFVNEIGLISALQHPNLVKLYGCCVEGNQMLLVYEYLKNNSLARALYGPEEFQLHLDWRTRHNICVGIAKGLAYLHEESVLKIVHRDIKTTNVLLDENLNPKISDFGLAKLKEDDSSHISTRVAGTFGYMAPEYALRGHLTDKADVYSYGIVVLEIISGRSNTSYSPRQESSFFLLDWAHLLKEKGDLLDLIDPRLDSDLNKDEVLRMIHVALLCANVSPSVRPAMSVVVNILEGKVEFPASIAESKDDNEDDKKIEAMRKHFKGDGEEVRMMQPDWPWSGSSMSGSISLSGTDLYPLSWSRTTRATKRS